MDKVLTVPEAVSVRTALAQADRSVGLCHGCFDILHAGHVYHLRRAAERADVLFVSITAAEYVGKGPHRPIFDDQSRLSVVAALEMVDYVVLSREATARSLIRQLVPDFYFKGHDYVDRADPRMATEVDAVREVGGTVVITDAGVADSSTRAARLLAYGRDEDRYSIVTESAP